MILDAIGGAILNRSNELLRPGGTNVTVAEPLRVQPDDGRAFFFVNEANRAQLAALAERFLDGRLKPRIGPAKLLSEAERAFSARRDKSGRTTNQIAE